MHPNKKHNWWSDLWDSVLLFIMFQSLIVPWNGLNSIKRPIDSSIADDLPFNKGLWPEDRESFVQDLSRSLYPEQGIPTYIFGFDNPGNSVLTQEMGATNYPQPNHDNDELSLETQDLIDVLWRQDIDMEKSVPFTDIATPHNQHENDVQVLQQKHADMFMPWLSNDGDLNGQDKDFMPAFAMEYANVDKCTDLTNFVQATSDEDKNAELLSLDKMQQEMDLLENFAGSENSPPLPSADLFLSQTAQGQDSASDDENSRLSRDSGFGESESTPCSAPPPLERLFSVDALSTPDLRISPTDQAQLFNQIPNFPLVDVAEPVHNADVRAESNTPSLFLGSHAIMEGVDELGDLGLGMHLLADDAPTFKDYHFPDAISDETPSTSTGITHQVAPMFSSGNVQFVQTQGVYKIEQADDTAGSSTEYEEFDRPGPIHFNPGSPDPQNMVKVDFLVKLLEAEEMAQEANAPKPRGRICRDEQILRENGVPFDMDAVVESTLEEYQALINNVQLTPQQLEIVKKIRRRGKNKVAARNCRARRVQGFDQLNTETHLLKQERSGLIEQYRQLKELKSEQSQDLEQMKLKLKQFGGKL